MNKPGAASHLVWSPDGRYLAAKGDAQSGIAVIDAATGETWRLREQRHALISLDGMIAA